MYANELIEIAKKDGKVGIEKAMREGQITLLRNSVFHAKRAQLFTIAAQCEEMLVALGGTVKKDGAKAVDLSKFPQKVNITLDPKNAMFNDLFLGSCRTTGKMISKDGEKYLFAFRDKDAAYLVEKFKGVVEVQVVFGEREGGAIPAKVAAPAPVKAVASAPETAPAKITKK